MRSTRSRLGAAATAATALAAVGILSLTGGTVAQLNDSITVDATVGVEGTTYGIARGVSYSVNAQKFQNGTAAGSHNEHIAADSRQGPAYNRTDLGAPRYIIPASLEVRDMTGVRSCASSNWGGNTQHCPGPSTPTGNALVSASSGNTQTAEKYRVTFRDHTNNSNPSINIHDVYTRVECREDGTTTAMQPLAAWEFGGNEAWFGQGRWGWFETPRDLHGPNSYSRYNFWMRSNGGLWNTSMTVEVQTISQTFSNPPRAVSAIVVYVATADDSTPKRYTDIAYVSKSECAVSPKSSYNLTFESSFGPLTPAISQQPLPTRSGNQRMLADNLPVTDFSNVANVSGQQQNPARQMMVTEEHGSLEVRDPLAGLPAEQSSETDTTATTPNSPSSPSRTTSATATSTPAAAAPTRPAASTTTSAGPGPTGTSTSVGAPPPTVSTAYVTADGERYTRAGGDGLTTAQRALVEEAISAAATAESGELADGATYAVTGNQLDGTTLIVTTADGGTLRIVWEK